MAYSCRIENVSSTYRYHTCGLVGALSRAFSSKSSITRFATPSEMGDQHGSAPDLVVEHTVTDKLGGVKAKFQKSDYLIYRELTSFRKRGVLL